MARRADGVVAALAGERCLAPIDRVVEVESFERVRLRCWIGEDRCSSSAPIASRSARIVFSRRATRQEFQTFARVEAIERGWNSNGLWRFLLRNFRRKAPLAKGCTPSNRIVRENHRSAESVVPVPPLRIGGGAGARWCEWARAYRTRVLPLRIGHLAVMSTSNQVPPAGEPLPRGRSSRRAYGTPAASPNQIGKPRNVSAGHGNSFQNERRRR
jgi:hypothetical protein